MFRDLFNPRKRAASREFEVALHYLLNDAKAVVPLLKETNKDKWPGFIDDILKGARPYEEATLVIGIFVQNSFKGLDPAARNQIATSIANENLVNPPKFYASSAKWLTCYIWLNVITTSAKTVGRYG
jgi:hypothetical protein